MKTIPLFLLVALFLSACDQSTVLKPDTHQSYLYRAFDSTGTLVVTGQLIMNLADTITGNWTLSAIPGAHNIGPQNGTGTLTGLMSGDSLAISLNPNMIDNNVFLLGHFSNGTITGKWEYVGFPGVINRGAFLATAQLLDKISTD
jgi:hypothetical protein